VETKVSFWLREVLIAQSYHPKCCYFYQDNMSTMAMITKRRQTSLRSRHINVRYFFIGDRIEKGENIMKHCKSDDMIADNMTKPLQGCRFRIARHLTMNIIRLNLALLLTILVTVLLLGF
jgi:hypothetical protein